MNEYKDLIETAIDGVINEDELIKYIIDNGGDEQLLTKLGYSNVIKSKKNINANIVDYVLRKCKNNKALLAGVFALLISSGQLFGYEVKSGDNLWEIAKASNCSVEEIRELNPHLAHSDLIRPGDNIVLPHQISQKNISNNNNTYIVVSGDSLWKIAQKHGCSLEDIYQLNPELKNKKYLQPGMTIILPNEKINNNSQEQNELNLDAVLKALREIESSNGANTIGDNGQAIGDYQLWEVFVEDYHRLGGKKDYKCHVVDGVAQPDDVRWDREKCEEMIKHVFKKYGYKNMQQILRGFGSGRSKRPGWNKGVSNQKLQEYIDAYNKYNK